MKRKILKHLSLLGSLLLLANSAGAAVKTYAPKLPALPPLPSLAAYQDLPSRQVLPAIHDKYVALLGQAEDTDFVQWARLQIAHDYLLEVAAWLHQQQVDIVLAPDIIRPYEEEFADTFSAPLSHYRRPYLQISPGTRTPLNRLAQEIAEVGYEVNFDPLSDLDAEHAPPPIRYQQKMTSVVPGQNILKFGMWFLNAPFKHNAYCLADNFALIKLRQLKLQSFFFTTIVHLHENQFAEPTVNNAISALYLKLNFIEQALIHLIHHDDPFQGAVIDQLGIRHVNSTLQRIKDRFNFALFQAARMLLAFNRIYAALERPDLTAKFIPHGTLGKVTIDLYSQDQLLYQLKIRQRPQDPPLQDKKQIWEASSIQNAYIYLISLLPILRKIRPLIDDLGNINFDQFFALQTTLASLHHIAATIEQKSYTAAAFKSFQEKMAVQSNLVAEQIIATVPSPKSNRSCPELLTHPENETLEE
jgi:hypothetical protein